MGEIIEVKVSRLVPAAWNYKTDGSPDEIAKLARSIDNDGSSGVWAVRELPGRSNKLEVMDGNHRLDAVLLLKWPTQWVENFGKISEAEAASIALRRNEQWFEPDPLKVSRLVSDVVLKEWSPEEFSRMTTHSLSELKAMQDIASWDWGTVPDMRKTLSTSITVTLTPDQMKAWNEYKSRVRLPNNADALLRAIGADNVSSE